MGVPTDRDAELVAVAMRSGPDLAEFCSDYVAMPRANGTRVPRAELIDEIAEAWAERATPAEASDVVYQDVVSNVKPQVDYYL